VTVDATSSRRRGVSGRRRSPTIAVERLTAERIPDFYALHGAPPFEWCHCVAWDVPTWDGFPERSAAENRALRERRLAAGRYDGYLLYVDGRVAGWCQCGPRDDWPKLGTQFALAPDPGTYAVTCFCILPEHRRQGLVHRLLGAILGDLRKRGATRVEGFPRPAGEHEDGEVWTGPLGVFTRAGFRPVSDAGKRLVVALELQQAAGTEGSEASLLGRYLDPQGRLTSWPKKRWVKDAALAFLAGKLAPERVYSEAEINTILDEWHTFGDPAIIRRELFDYGFVTRTRDGSQYRIRPADDQE
jgi:ribosomal protein S18 acetylase RimI-like enzyme